MDAPHDDLELARRCIAGDPAAREDLVRGTIDLLFHASRRVLGNDADAEDAVQTVYLRLFEDDARRLKSYEGRSRLSTWLVTIVRRTALELRERRPIPDRVPMVEESDPAGLAEAGEVVRLLQDAMGRLPARDHLLLMLIYTDGLTYPDAARILGASPNSISPWLARARERLKEMIAPRPEI